MFNDFLIENRWWIINVFKIFDLYFVYVVEAFITSI